MQKAIAETKKRAESQTAADSEAAKETDVKNESNNKQPDTRAIQEGSSVCVYEQYTDDCDTCIHPLIYRYRLMPRK